MDSNAERSWKQWYHHIKDEAIGSRSPEEWIHRAYKAAFTAGQMIGEHTGRGEAYGEGYKAGYDDAVERLFDSNKPD